MSNFKIFDQSHLGLLIEPFVPGMSKHILPIKYEALTPDSFLLLFCTRAPNGSSHYFVSYESDYVESKASAASTIESWHAGKILGFLPLQELQGHFEDQDIDQYLVATSGPYKAVLAEVEKPNNASFWSKSTTISPGDNIGEKISHYPSAVQAKIRKALVNVLERSVDVNASFLDSYKSKRNANMSDDINNSSIEAVVYVTSEGGIEIFSNHINQTVGGRPKKL